MKRIGTILTMIALMGGLGLSRLAYAQPPVDFTKDEVEMVKRKRAHMEAMKAKMQEELGLTEDQIQKLDEHRAGHKDQIREYRDAMRRLREEFMDEVEESEIDVAKVYSVHEKMKTLDHLMADHRLEGLLELRKILTPEQFKKFHEKAGKMREGMGEEHGRHGRNKGDRDGFMPGGH